MFLSIDIGNTNIDLGFFQDDRLLRHDSFPTPSSRAEIHSCDLLRAHLRYAAHYDTTGNAEAATLERGRIGETLVRALADENTSAGSLNALAWYCATADMYLDESLEAATRATALEPDNSGTLDTLAEVLFRLGRKEEAVETIDRALAIDPGDEYLQGQRKKVLNE